MAMALVWPGSMGGLTRSLPLAQTTPPGTVRPATLGSRPRAYFSQLGTPSPAGVALGAAFGLVLEPKYWICHASGRPSVLPSPVRSAIEALSKPAANGALCTPLLPSLLTNCQL